MPDDHPTSPLLGQNDQQAWQDGQPAVERHSSHKSSLTSRRSSRSDESTPLLAREDTSLRGDGDDENEAENGTQTKGRLDWLKSPFRRKSQNGLQDDTETESQAEGRPKRSRARTPVIVALSLLSFSIILILVVGFAAPAVIEEYALQAATFEPTDLSIDSFTSSGIKARIKGNFRMDGNKVHKKPVRDLGRAGTWIARAIETQPSKVEVYLPEYGNEVLGTADVPGIVVGIRDGHTTHLDFVAEIEPGEKEALRRIAREWMDGKLGELRVTGKAKIPIKSGIFNLGTQTISQTVLFAGHEIPAVPKYNISKLLVHEIELPEEGKAMVADVSITAFNDYPISFTVPPLGFEMLVPGCTADEPYISIADATTKRIDIEAHQEVIADAESIVRQLPEDLISVCPDSESSPLDSLIHGYMRGDRTTVYVRGSKSPPASTPAWIAELLRSITVPVPLEGSSFNNLLREFSMDKVHLSMPNPLADPDTPEGQPRISAVVKVVANLPKVVNFPIDVNRVRADSKIYYEGRELGILDLHQWQDSTSHRETTDDEDEQPLLIVESVVKEAPLNITDNDVFSDVVQAMIFGGEAITLGVKADVDIETSTTLGTFIVRGVPAEGKVPIKPIETGPGDFKPVVSNMHIIDTTKTSLLMGASVGLTNPTNYSADIPYASVQIWCNGTLIGEASVRDMAFRGGYNEGIAAQVVWDPADRSGEEGAARGRELLSQYISGYNATMTIRTHEGSIPGMPHLGAMLSNYSIEMPMPRMSSPKRPRDPDDPDDGDGNGDDDDDDSPHFIESATMHLFSSTATFILLSPFPKTTMYITWMDATAFYNHTEPIGTIKYDLPFAVPPGRTESPRLPVDWTPDSFGYDAIKQALGGSLKLDANATCGVRMGKWEDVIWFQGRGIGSNVRL